MQNALLFIPDISGFSSFVKKTEINHSKHIIKELLELLIDSNQIGLQLAEIEGDALFFYKIIDALDPENLAKQIETMYKAFHEHLLFYEHRRICTCGACASASGLKIKFVVHEALIEFIEIKDKKKPYGPEVIKVHRLLKNQVPLDEYALFTRPIIETHKPFIDQFFGKHATVLAEDYDVGSIEYAFSALDQIELKKVKEIFGSKPPLGRLVLSKSIQIEANQNDAFEFLVDFDQRHFWSEGVEKIEYDEKIVNRIGSKHICVIGNDNIEQSTIFANIKDNDLVYVESTQDIPILKNINTEFTIKKTKTGSLVDVKFYTRSSSFLGKIFTPLIKLKLGKNVERSLLQFKRHIENTDNL